MKRWIVHHAKSRRYKKRIWKQRHETKNQRKNYSGLFTTLIPSKIVGIPSEKEWTKEQIQRFETIRDKIAGDITDIDVKLKAADEMINQRKDIIQDYKELADEQRELNEIEQSINRMPKQDALATPEDLEKLNILNERYNTKRREFQEKIIKAASGIIPTSTWNKYSSREKTLKEEYQQKLASGKKMIQEQIRNIESKAEQAKTNLSIIKRKLSALEGDEEKVKAFLKTNLAEDLKTYYRDQLDRINLEKREAQKRIDAIDLSIFENQKQQSIKKMTDIYYDLSRDLSTNLAELQNKFRNETNQRMTALKFDIDAKQREKNALQVARDLTLEAIEPALKKLKKEYQELSPRELKATYKALKEKAWEEKSESMKPGPGYIPPYSRFRND